MVQSDSVRSKAGQQGRMRDEKPIWRADDRLSQTTQTAWERSRNNIRSQQVHDRNLQFGVCLDGSLPVFERKPGPFHYYPKIFAISSCVSAVQITLHGSNLLSRYTNVRL